jgi:uncharacterized repeat protein (TIGR03847 family)
MSIFREFDQADFFTTGAVGAPGARTFFLQVGSEDDALSIKCEKEQVIALAAYLRKLLEDAPAVRDREKLATPLREPVDAAFALGSIGLAYDRQEDRVVLQFEEVSPDDEPEFDASRVRARITRAQAVSFCENADRLAKAGRPPCVFCGLPVNRDSHACPRMN